MIEEYIKTNILSLDARLSYRGIGLIWGIDFMKLGAEKAIVCSHDCFEHGLIVELAGRHDSVLKLMPALTIEDHVLMEGLNIIKESVAQSVKKCFNYEKKYSVAWYFGDY